MRSNLRMRHAVVFLGLILLATVTTAKLYEPGESTQIGYLYDRPKITFDTPESDGTTMGIETTTTRLTPDEDDRKKTKEDNEEGTKKTDEEPVERRKKKSLLT